MKKVLASILCLLMVFTLMPTVAMADGTDQEQTGQDQTGLVLKVNGEEDILPGETLTGEAGEVIDAEIWFNGKRSDGENLKIMEVYTDEERPTVCASIGTTPKGENLQIRIMENAPAGGTCTVFLKFNVYDDKKIFMGSGDETFTLEVAEPTPKIRLKWGDGFVEQGETFGSAGPEEAEIYLGDKKLLTGEYEVRGGGYSAVCALNDDGNGKLTFTPNGNGDCRFSIVSKGPSGERSDFTFHVEGLSDETPKTNMAISCSDQTVLPGGKLLLIGNGKEYTGTAMINGRSLSKDEYTIETFGPNGGCVVQYNDNRTFTLKTPSKDGYSDLRFVYRKGQDEYYIGSFDVQVQTPTQFLLQTSIFYPGEGEKYNFGGYSTGLAFKKKELEKYARFIVTDQEMRRIDESHFVAVTPNNLEVEVYNWRKGKYEDLTADEIPFKIDTVSGQETKAAPMLKITYLQEKDKQGPAYRLNFTGADKYLDGGIPSEKHIYLWTAKVNDTANWKRMGCDEQQHWTYNAKVTVTVAEDGQENDEVTENVEVTENNEQFVRTEECEIEHVAVEFPDTLFGQGTGYVGVDDKTTLAVETDLGDVTLDGKVLGLIDGANQDVTLDVVKVEEGDKDYQNISGALEDAALVMDLNLCKADGSSEISDFEGGTASVNLDYQLSDTGKAEGKTPCVYYVDENGTKHAVTSTYNEAEGTVSFDTNHFSVYIIEEAKDDATEPGPGTDPGSYIPTNPAADSLEKVKTETTTVVEDYVKPSEYEAEETAEINEIVAQAKKDIAAAKTKEEVKAIEEKAKAEIDKLETAAEKAEIRTVESTKFRAKSKPITLKGKKAVKVTWNKPAGMDFDGYDVFRSLKRDKGYGKKPFFTTTKQSYINTKDLKAGKTYYYKVRGFKYVNDEKVYTEWSYKAWRTVK